MKTINLSNYILPTLIVAWVIVSLFHFYLTQKKVSVTCFEGTHLVSLTMRKDGTLVAAECN